MYIYNLKRWHALATAGLALMVSPVSYAQSWYDTAEYRAQFGLGLINAAAAYDLGYTGSGVTVGVIDSGINSRHPEFWGQLLGGYDMDANRPIIPGTENYDDEAEGHGSHVAGIIAARKDGVGMHGVAFDARLWVFKPKSDLGDAFSFAAQQRLKIVNLSLGLNDCSAYAKWKGENTDPYCNVTSYADQYAVESQMAEASAIRGLHALKEAGSLVVLATGNETQDHPDILAGSPYLYPELKDNFIAVASVDADGSLADYSNKCGVAADWCLSAPGGVSLEDGGHGSIYSVDSGGGYFGENGTSMAAPHVAGAAAMVAQAFPYFTAYQLQQTVLTTATELGDPAIFGWGMLNVGKAVKGPGRITDLFHLDTQGTHTHFANDIGGVDGILIKDGAGSLELSGVNTYRTTTVRGGKLIVNGTQVNPVAVEPAGTLEGSGFIGGLTNHGTINPGNSIGTLTVKGDFHSSQESRIQIEVDAEGRSDRIHVEGTADIQNATLEMAGGPVRPTASYQFLTVDGGIVGQFNPKVELNSAFLDTQLDARTHHVNLNVVRNATAFTQYAHGPNQHAVANALDNVSNAPVSGLQPLYDNILNSDGSTVATLTEQIAGEVHSSVQSALVQSEWQWSREIIQQARARRPAGAQARPAWVQVQTSHATLAGRNGLSDLKHDRNGIALGAQLPLSPAWSVGGGLSYSDGKSSLKNRAESVRSNSYSAALYAAAQWPLQQGQLTWLGGVGYSHHGLNSRRALDALQVQALKADSSSTSVQVFTELGWTIPVGVVSSVEPYMGMNWMQLRSGAFEEAGGLLALSAPSQHASTSSISLGLRSTTVVGVGGTDITLHTGLSWRHAMGRRTAQRDLTLLANPVVGFTTQGATLAKDMAEVDLAARIRVGNHADVSLQYRGGFGQSQRQHAGMLSLQSRF